MTAVPSRRPRGRRDQLVRLAADLFHRHGFHGVGVNDIAAAAGITGPALYRHFPSKQALLVHVLQTGVARLHEVVDDALDGDGTAAQRLDRLNVRLAEIAVEHRSVAALWRWEGRHLPAEDAAEVRRIGGKLIAAWTQALRARRPELTETEAELRCWAALSVFASVADHRVSLPRRRFAALLARLADAALAAPRATAEPAAAAEHDQEPAEQGRREELLSCGTALFRARGFHLVSVEDIAAACGLAPASFYRYFPSKLDLLAEACRRMAARLTDHVHRVRAEAGSAEQTVTALLDSYVDTALRERDLISVYVTELDNLSSSERTELIRLQRAYVAEWVAALHRLRGELDEASAKIVVHATLTIVNDLVRTERHVSRSGYAAELVRLGSAVLTRHPAILERSR